MGNFTEEEKLAAWNNAPNPPEGYNKDNYRLDSCGALIYWHSYGKDTEMGWEVDHIFPQEKGGKNDFVNLRAMQHQNNSSKSDDYPSYYCKVTLSGKATPRTVNKQRRDILVKLYGKKAE